MRARVSYYLAAVLLITVLGAATACSNKPDDAKISSDIQASFNGDSGLQGKQLSIQSANGTVTLGGAVENEAQRDAAARYAAAAPGVKQVVNNLVVGAAPAPVEAAQAQPAPTEEPAPAPAPTKSRRSKPSPSRHHHREPAPSADDNPAPMASQPATMTDAQMQPPPPSHDAPA